MLKLQNSPKLPRLHTGFYYYANEQVNHEKRYSDVVLVTSLIVINVPTRDLLGVETMHAIVQWLANLNVKRNMTSIFANKKHRYSAFHG